MQTENLCLMLTAKNAEEIYQDLIRLACKQNVLRMQLCRNQKPASLEEKVADLILHRTGASVCVLYFYSFMLLFFYSVNDHCN